MLVPCRWWRGLRISVTLEGYTGRFQSRGQTKVNTRSSRLGSRLTTSPQKKVCYRNNDTEPFQWIMANNRWHILGWIESGELREKARPLKSLIFNTIVSTCNVWTLFQCGRMDQVLKTMKDLYNLGVREMRWTEQGCLTTNGATVLGKQNHHTHGVGIIHSNCAARALVGWKPVNDASNHCAPAKVASEEDKDAFYSQLQTIIGEIPSYDTKMLIGERRSKLEYICINTWCVIATRPL